jgi:cbb3-type cytochrome c oxidase subunit III
MTRAVRLLTLACFLAAFTSGCERKPDDLREWTPADHTHQTETGANPQRAPKTVSPAEESQREVSAAIWKQQCETCHGVAGRGDGPQSVMVQARDLTDPAWQETTPDAVMALIIKQGKGKMPAFRFPDTTVSGLVDLVRRFGRARAAAQRRPNVPATAPANAAPGAPVNAAPAAPPPAAPPPGAPAAPAAPPAQP